MDEVESWSLKVPISSTVAHVIGILTTIFRLLHRWHLSKFWWEDTWAALALICDMACLASVWMPIVLDDSSPIATKANWLLSLTITCILWFSRMSILCSVVRIANPTRGLRLVAYCIGGMFIAMGAGLLAQKIFFCLENLCRFNKSVAIAQLVTDVVSDIMLVAFPIRCLRDVRLPRDCRILIISAFSASMLITGVTIFHSILLFDSISSTTMIIGHFKAALALFLCNALVLVTFVYRLCHKSAVDPDYFMTEGCSTGTENHGVQFTSIIDLPSKLSSRVQPDTSVVQSGGDIT